MIIQFTVGNYRSFHEPVTLSMLAANISSKDKRLDDTNVFSVAKDISLLKSAKDISLLKSAAVYGANASGKSNLVHALRFMREFVLRSSKDMQSGEPIEVERFRLSEETRDQPSCFEIVFLAEGTQYRYGFEVNTRRVVAEWLFHVPKTREARLFERHLDEMEISDVFEMSGVFKEGKGLPERTRENALFLSVVAQFNGKISRRILRWFRNLGIISGLHDRGYLSYTFDCLIDGEHKHREKIIQLIERLDLGFDAMQPETVPVNPDQLPPDMPEKLREALLSLESFEERIKTIHRRYNQTGQVVAREQFDLHDHESEGTKKIVALAGPLIDTLETGKPLIIDELDARLHPLITGEIIKLFNDTTTNPRNAQLIFMTHDTNLLDKKLLRRDQIWFTEKDRMGATHLYSLVEYKVRNDASFESDYIRGKYGAIPFIGDVSRVIGEMYVEEIEVE